MSLAMRVARASAQGDPGLFGILGGIAKGALGVATGGLSSAVIGGVQGLLGGGGRKSVSTAKASVFTSGRPGMPVLQGGGGGISIGGPGGVVIGNLGSNTGQPKQLGPGVGGPLVGNKPQTACTSGYHYNKQGYHSKRYGWIEKGTVCVRNRRRNPLNPRALSKAMSRIASAQKAVKCLGLFAGAPARASAKRAKKVGAACRRK